MHEKFKDQGVVIIGVCVSRNGQDRFDAVVEQQGLQYPVARDASMENAERYRVMWWPTYALIDRQGTLRALGLQSGKVEEAVEKLLAEQPADQSAAAE
jgi:peroxiredoxin